MDVPSNYRGDKMPYIAKKDRNQLMMCSLESFVAPESIARIIDQFVENLDMDELGFQKTVAAIEGRPGFNPRCMLKLYLYGSRKSIRSSRKLDEACKINLEIKWMLCGQEPDFRTISDFRKDNIKCMKKVFRAFNRRLVDLLKKGEISIDGSKFQANNSKDNNLTANKLDDRIQWLNQHTDEYLRQIAEIDEREDEELAGQFTREELEKKLKEATERLERYMGYQKYMEEEGLSQISLTDADARLMKNKNGFAVAYNVQTAVDTETHIIEDYLVTNQPTDHGLMGATLEYIKEQSSDEILNATADKGYIVDEDMIGCLENGIIPHVILPDGKDHYELEIEYEEAESDAAMAESKNPEDLKKCLHAGVIPEAYKEVIESIEVIEKRRLVKDGEEGTKKETPYGTVEEMKERAESGYFVRDPERNLVYCPAGEILRQKAVKKNGNIRYANKTACKNCKYRNQCYKGRGEWKEIDFNKDTLEKKNQYWPNQTEDADQTGITYKGGDTEQKEATDKTESIVQKEITDKSEGAVVIEINSKGAGDGLTEITDKIEGYDVAEINDKGEGAWKAEKIHKRESSLQEEIIEKREGVEQTEIINKSEDTSQTEKNDHADAADKPNTNKSLEKKKKGHYEKVKVVRITLVPNRQIMDKRKCTSEHPFGTIKRAMNAGYYLLRGMQKVDGETALMCLGYNIQVAINLLGFEKMMQAMA